MAAVHVSSEDSLADALANVGLQRQRAKAMKVLAIYLISEHAGVVPRDLESLRNVPGLGEYNSRAVLSFGYGTPEAVVDTNVTRVLHRIFRGALSPRSKQSVYQALADHVLPEEHHREFNLAMLDLRAMVCRYDRPRCEECPLRGECDFHGCRQGDNEAGFTSQLSTIRVQHGIPLARLAARAGGSKPTTINIEHGRTRPETVKKLAGALGVSPEKLVSDIER